MIFRTICLAVAALLAAPVSAQRVLVDDFQSARPGGAPAAWKFFTKDREFLDARAFMSDDEEFKVVQEGGNRFVRAFTEGEALRITRRASDFGWNLDTHPRLRWDWRALRLPLGAREDKTNDAGGAVYVTFDKTDWLGRPLSIKYTYSSTLPVGTVVSSGPVKVIVASSAVDGFGTWKTVERDVVADYRRLFGKAPGRPYALTLWSDSDDTRTIGEVDFDNIAILPAR